MTAGVAAMASGLAIGAAAVAGHGPPPDRGPITAAEAEAVANRIGPAVVAVEAVGCGRALTGSGFLVEGRVVTSGHILAGAAELRFAVAGGIPRGGRAAAVAGSFAPSDVAFSTPVPQAAGLGAGLRLASDPLPDGTTPVVIAGRVGGRLRWLAASARTVDGAAYGAGGPLLVLDQEVAPGWSGGPVVDRGGAVVGVVRAIDSALGITLAEPMGELAGPGVWSRRDRDDAAPIGCNGP